MNQSNSSKTALYLGDDTGNHDAEVSQTLEGRSFEANLSARNLEKQYLQPSQEHPNDKGDTKCGVENTDTGLPSSEDRIEIYQVENYFQKTLFDELRSTFNRLQKRLNAAQPEHKAQYRILEAQAIDLADKIACFTENNFFQGVKDPVYKATYRELTYCIEKLDQEEATYFNSIWQKKGERSAGNNLIKDENSLDSSKNTEDITIKSFLTAAKATECKDSFFRIKTMIARSSASHMHLVDQLVKPYEQIIDTLTTTENSMLRSLIGEIYAVVKEIKNMKPGIMSTYDSNNLIQNRIDDLKTTMEQELNAMKEKPEPTIGEVALRAKTVSTVSIGG